MFGKMGRLMNGVNPVRCVKGVKVNGFTVALPWPDWVGVHSFTGSLPIEVMGEP